MKLKLCYLAILSVALFLQACGGGGLAGNDGKDTDTIFPEAGVEDTSARPRPPENAVVLTTDQHFIYDSALQPVVLRGVNHLYSDNPNARINGISAIKLTGSNVVRLQLDENTTEIQFQGAMSKIAQEGMVALVTLTAKGNKLTCTEESAYLLSAVDNLWLKKFLPVLVQDSFQPHLMLNIANGWGPMNIFNQDSLGYREYIDTYKALIRKFRNAGFKFPLVIDAPGCGQDFNAFLSGRSRELMAADSAKNLVFGVHADGPKWNTADKIVNAATQLYNEKVPFIVTEFTGSGVAGIDEEPIDHKDLIVKSAGDVAMAFDLPWASTSDTIAYAVTLDEALDLQGGAVVSVNVFVDKIYSEFVLNSSSNLVPTGKLTFALYVSDAGGNTLRAGSNFAGDLRSNQWSKLAYTLPKDLSEIDPANYMNGASTFDLTAISQIGIQILANGKPISLKAPIKFDELTILPGIPPMYVASFDDSVDDWANEWGSYTLAQENGALSLLPTPTGDQMSTGLTAWRGADLSNLNFAKTLDVTMRMYFPAEYEADFNGVYFQLWGRFGSDWSYQPQVDIDKSKVKFGEWVNITTRLNWVGDGANAGKEAIKQSFGMQIGGFSAGKTQPILIDSISVSDANGKPTITVTALQYKATFTKGTEGFVNAGWDEGQSVVTMENGELLVTLPENDKGAINKADVNSIGEIDLKGDVTIKMKLFVPVEWAGDDFALKLFMQDGGYRHFQYAEINVSNLTPGEWTSLEFNVTEFPAEFSRTLKPQMFGVQFANVPAGTIKFDDIEIYGNTEVDDSQPIFAMDFSTQAQLDAFQFDFAGGAFSEAAVVTAKQADWRVVPFGWTASSWKGHTGDKAVLDISLDEDMVNLTERGEEIVNGELGIVETSLPVTFE